MLCLLSRASVIWNQFAWFAEYVLLCFVWSLVCHPPPPSAPWCPAAPVIRPMRLILFISLLHNTPRLGCHVCVDRPPRVVKGAWIFLRHAIKFQEGWACPWHGRGKLLSTGVFVLAGLLRFLGQRSCRLNLLSVFALAGLLLAHVCNDLRSQI